MPSCLSLCQYTCLISSHGGGHGSYCVYTLPHHGWWNCATIVVGKAYLIFLLRTELPQCRACHALLFIPDETIVTWVGWVPSRAQCMVLWPLLWMGPSPIKWLSMRGLDGVGKLRVSWANPTLALRVGRASCPTLRGTFWSNVIEGQSDLPALCYGVRRVSCSYSKDMLRGHELSSTDHQGHVHMSAPDGCSPSSHQPTRCTQLGTWCKLMRRCLIGKGIHGTCTRQ